VVTTVNILVVVVTDFLVLMVVVVLVVTVVPVVGTVVGVVVIVVDLVVTNVVVVVGIFVVKREVELVDIIIGAVVVKPLLEGESFEVLTTGLDNVVVLITSLNFANSSGLKVGMPLATSTLASGSSKLSSSLCENVVALGGSSKLLALTVILPSFG